MKIRRNGMQNETVIHVSVDRKDGTFQTAIVHAPSRKEALNECQKKWGVVKHDKWRMI